MINEDLLIPFYSDIANVLNSVIPVEWSKAAIYFEELDGSFSAKYYFFDKEKNCYVNDGKMPDLYGIDLCKYSELNRKVVTACQNLRNEFINQGEPPWVIMSFFIDEKFNFNAEFEYDYNREISTYARMILWAYKKLNIIPSSDFDKELLEENL